MKIFLTLFLFCSLVSFKLTEKTKLLRSKWVISERSSLIINGTTNVNKFACAIMPYPKTDTVLITEDKANNLLLSGQIHIKVKEFDCSNYVMTRELRKTLKENHFPFLHIRFISLKEVSGTSLKTKVIKGLIEIEIAGKAKQFQIEYQLNIDKNNLTLSGIQSINFSDFDLQPPKKMGMLIKAKNELKVALYLKMELI